MYKGSLNQRLSRHIQYPSCTIRCTGKLLTSRTPTNCDFELNRRLSAIWNVSTHNSDEQSLTRRISTVTWSGSLSSNLIPRSYLMNSTINGSSLNGCRLKHGSKKKKRKKTEGQAKEKKKLNIKERLALEDEMMRQHNLYRKEDGMSKEITAKTPLRKRSLIFKQRRMFADRDAAEAAKRKRVLSACDFWFSKTNLLKDDFLRQTIKRYHGYVPIKVLLTLPKFHYWTNGQLLVHAFHSPGAADRYKVRFDPKLWRPPYPPGWSKNAAESGLDINTSASMVDTDAEIPDRNNIETSDLESTAMAENVGRSDHKTGSDEDSNDYESDDDFDSDDELEDDLDDELEDDHDEEDLSDHEDDSDDDGSDYGSEYETDDERLSSNEDHSYEYNTEDYLKSRHVAGGWKDDKSENESQEYYDPESSDSSEDEETIRNRNRMWSNDNTYHVHNAFVRHRQVNLEYIELLEQEIAQKGEIGEGGEEEDSSVNDEVKEKQIQSSEYAS